MVYYSTSSVCYWYITAHVLSVIGILRHMFWVLLVHYGTCSVCYWYITAHVLGVTGTLRHMFCLLLVYYGTCSVCDSDPHFQLLLIKLGNFSPFIYLSFIRYTFRHNIPYDNIGKEPHPRPRTPVSTHQVSAFASAVAHSICDAQHIFLSPTSASRVPAEATGRQ